MKKLLAIPILLLLVGCASTPIQREMQLAIAIKQVQTQTIAALDFGVMDADTGEAVQVGTRTATDMLRKAIATRRSGMSVSVSNAMLDGVLSALANVQAILLKGEK